MIYKEDFFINAKQDKLVLEKLPIIKPKTLNEWNNICQYAAAKNLHFKLIKSIKSQFINPSNDNMFVVDVDSLDNIINLNTNSVKCLPGATASQLNDYLDKIYPETTYSVYQMPLSLILSDPLLIYSCNSQQRGMQCVEYHLNNNQIDNRWFVIGFNSLEDLFNTYHAAMQLKKDLSHFILSFFYINQHAFDLIQQRLNWSKVLNFNKIYSHNLASTYQWFLLIEIPYNEHIFSGIKKLVTERLGNMASSINYYITKFKKKLGIECQLDDDGLMDNKSSSYFCQTMSFHIPNDVNHFLYAYHCLYTNNLREKFKLNIFLDVVSYETIKLSTKIYYSSSAEKQNILNYMLDTMNRLKLKVK